MRRLYSDPPNTGRVLPSLRRLWPTTSEKAPTLGLDSSACCRADCMLDLVDADAEDAVSFTSAASADSPKGYGHAHGGGGQTWERVRAVIRYVTQKPWNRIPPITRTLIYNPVLACLAGGRNKARCACLCRRPSLAAHLWASYVQLAMFKFAIWAEELSSGPAWIHSAAVKRRLYVARVEAS